MKSWLWLLAAFFGFGLIFFGEPYLQDFLEKQVAQPEKSSFLLRFYPSFITRWEALGSESFWNYLQQIKFRWLLFCGFGYVLFRFLAPALQKPLPEKPVRDRIRFFFVLQMLYLPDLLAELTLRHQWKAFYISTFPFGSGLPFPHMPIIQGMGILSFAIGAYFVLSNWKPGTWMPTALGAGQLMIWCYLLLLFFGFGKVDHTYASMTSALVVLAVWFTLWALGRVQAGGFRAFQAAIWGCYFFSGMEKIFLSGWHWVQPIHFETLSQLHPNGLGHTLSQWPLLGSTLMLLALIFQLSTILLLWFPRWGLPVLVMGIFFHLGTWVLLDVGGWQSPWIPMLFFLWPFQDGEKKHSPPARE